MLEAIFLFFSFCSLGTPTARSARVESPKASKKEQEKYRRIKQPINVIGLCFFDFFPFFLVYRTHGVFSKLRVRVPLLQVAPPRAVSCSIGSLLSVSQIVRLLSLCFPAPSTTLEKGCVRSDNQLARHRDRATARDCPQPRHQNRNRICRICFLRGDFSKHQEKAKEKAQQNRSPEKNQHQAPDVEAQPPAR